MLDPLKDMTLFPKNSSVVKLDAAIAPNSLAIYEQEGKALLAVVRGFKRDKYLLLNQRGREVELSAARLHLLPDKLPTQHSTNDSQTGYLCSLSEQCDKLSTQINLEEIWSFVIDEARDFSTKELCQLYYGKDSLSDHLSLHYALIRDQIFFKRKKDSFCPRTAETIEELRKAAIARDNKSLAIERTISFFKLRLSDKTAPPPEEVAELITCLEQTAAGMPWRDNSQQREIKEILQRLQQELELSLRGTIEQQAFAALKKIGHFHNDTNLHLIFYNWPRSFSAAALSEAEKIIPSANLTDYPEPDHRIRLDLTNLAAITIDDASTKDMDDALSLEQTESGYRLGIHISDTATWIARSSVLDQEALQRATSLYLPEGKLHMLPEILAEDRLSLALNQIKPAVSCLIDLDQRLQVEKFTLQPSLIKVKRRLSYEEVNEQLEQGDNLLNQLYQVSAGLEAVRISNGAIRMPKREAGIKIGPDGQITLYEINEQTAAHMLVGEMMILANSLIANFASQHAIPMVFRGQEAPEQDIDTAVQDLPEGPAREYAARGKLKPSIVSLSPLPHSSLALDAYLQATSPIRRYSDLINQRQLLSYLRYQKPQYEREDLEKILPGLNELSRSAVLISRKTKRYWLLKYLKQQLSYKSTWTATVVRNDLKSPLIEIDGVYLTNLLKTSQQLRVGETVAVKVSAVEPRLDYLKLELDGTSNGRH